MSTFDFDIFFDIISDVGLGISSLVTYFFLIYYILKFLKLIFDFLYFILLKFLKKSFPGFKEYKKE